MTRRIRIRTLLLGGLLTLLFVGLFGRIYWVQVAHASYWADKARATWSMTKKLMQERGTLTDRDGQPLALDAPAYTLAVSPKKIHELEEAHPEWRLLDQIVSKIHLVLDKPEAEVRTIVNAKKDGTYYDQREVRNEGWKMDKSVADRLIAFREQLREQTKQKDVGIYFVEEKKRYYPNDSLASHILGYEDKEGKAIMGLEKALDADLRGEPGEITYEKDGISTRLPDGKVEAKQPVDGKNVTLTIDREIQYYMEQALREAYAKYNPVSLTAVAADPKTGDILGMVSLPDFDPNKYWNYSSNQAAFKNNAIQSVYEPGSTFKIVTLAAAVQEGIFKPNAMYKSGSIYVPDKTIRDHNYVGWGEISFLDGLKHSSNVAFVKLGMELGREKLRSYIDNFGFGVKTGIELGGEVPGAISFYYPVEVATAAFGQGRVLVTPIQQVAAIGAVANGGKLMAPHLIKSVTDPTTGKKTVVEPKVVRQVISEETSRQVGEYLEQVVSDQNIGTGRNAYIPGYRIAGKTGTAQVVVNGKYAEDKYVISFIGYAPVEDPKIVLYIIMDRPDDKLAGGGSVVAPIFKTIMGQSLRHLGVKPNLTAEEKDKEKNKNKDGESEPPAPVTATVPDVSGMTTSRAKTELAGRSFASETLGKGAKVLRQLPKAGSVMPTSQTIYLITEDGVGNVPDLKGMSLRDALEMCKLLEASCVPQGEGYVAAQSSAKANGKLVVTLALAPPGQEAEVAALAEEAAGDGANASGEEGDAAADGGSSGDGGADSSGSGPESEGDGGG